MAVLVSEGDELVVHLSKWERAASFCGDVRVPRSAVRSVRVSERPFRELRGAWRWGLAVPGLIIIGKVYYRGGPDFVAIRRGRPAIVVELEGADYTRLIVSQPDLVAARGTLNITGLAPAPA